MRALIIVDVQNDFCEGGSLAVAGGSAVARAISEHVANATQYAHVVATKDFHVDPGSHFSDHPDYAASWPPHCVAGTSGADFHPNLETGGVEAVFTKGQHAAAYSGFEGQDDAGTPLAGWLRARGVDEVDVVGIATDYCVHATAADAIRAGFVTRVLLDLTAGVAPESTAKAIEDLRAAHVELTGAPRLYDCYWSDLRAGAVPAWKELGTHAGWECLTGCMRTLCPVSHMGNLAAARRVRACGASLWQGRH